MTGPDVASVLAGHRWVLSADEGEWYVVCSCGYQSQEPTGVAHVAAAVRAEVARWLTSGGAVGVAAQAIHAHQEYSTCWNDEQAGSVSRMGTAMRALGEHGRTFYRGLATTALSALAEQLAPARGDGGGS